MTELESQYRRWTELMDRRAGGDPLSDDEEAFCQRFTAQHPAAAREEALLAELADLDATPTAESRALVDATLARMADDTAKAERAELSRLRSNVNVRVPRAAWLVAGALAAAAVALVIALPHKRVAKPPVIANAVYVPPPAARVELVYASGDVRVNGVQLTQGSAVLLAEGSRVSVGAGAAACLAMDPDIDVCARSESELLLSRMHSPSRRVDLLRGKVGVQLAPQPPGYQFSIVAADVWSTAVGTAFTVSNERDQAVRTTVMNGKVRVGTDSAHEQLVAAHQRSDVHGNQALIAAVGRSEESSEWALLRPAALWHNLVSSTLVVHGEPASAEVVLDDQAIGVAPLATLIPAGGHRLQVRAQGRVLLSRELTSEVGQIATVEYAPAASNSEPALEREPAGKTHARSVRRSAGRHEEPAQVEQTSAAEMLREAHRLMRNRSFDDAARQYESLRATYPEAPEASAVLVSLAELQLDRLGRPALALAGVNEYLAGRSTALAEEAEQVRIRALRALGEPEREAAAIEDFVRVHPRSFRTPALQRRLAELQAAQ